MLHFSLGATKRDLSKIWRLLTARFMHLKGADQAVDPNNVQTSNAAKRMLTAGSNIRSPETPVQ